MTTLCAADDAPTIQVPDQPHSLTLSVPGLKCAGCIGKIERGLSATPGVRDARVNMTLKRVNIATGRPVDEMVQALEALGFQAFPLDEAALGRADDPVARDLLLRTGVAGFAMMNVMLLSVAIWSGASDATRDLFHLISAAIALPAALYAGQPFFRSAAGALRLRRLNMDVPISLAILLAGGLSLFEALNGGAHAYFDAALSLTFFLLIGRVLEHRTRATARSAAKELSALEVHTAQRIENGTVTTVKAGALAVGDQLLVPHGMRVPVDGSLSSPEAVTDTSFLTGESEPVSHRKGAALQAGEINLGAPFEITATAVGQDTRLRQMARLVETAETVRNRYTSLADRIAGYYAPVVHFLAAATFLGWWIASGDARHALNVAIAVLIITCPCALGLAVPAVSTAAIGRLYRLGFLVTSGTALERLAKVDTVLLDKTGTLTKPGFDFDMSTLGEAETRIAKALAQASSHPLARALDGYLRHTAPSALIDIREHPGKGLRAMQGGTRVALGQADWLGAEGTGLALRIGDTVRLLPHTETERPGAAALGPTFDRLGLTPHIVSGDTVEKTRAMANRLNIANWQARTSPEGKHDLVAALNKNGKTTCMIGDGVNDTAALQAAHASVTPGTALDAARSAADVVMLADDLIGLPDLFTTARRAVALYKQNFAIAFAYNAVAIPFAIAGFATPLMAAIAMSTSSIAVLLNASRARAAS